MRLVRSPLTVPLTVLAAVLLLLTAVAPVLGAPTGVDGSRTALTAHEIPECDEITFDAEGNLAVGGELLTEAQLALLDTDALGVLALAAAANAAGTGEVCVDVELGEAVVTVNANIEFCPVLLEVDAEGTLTVDGVELDAELLGADLAELLVTFAEAGIETCLLVHVEDNQVTVDALAQACLTSTLNEDGSLTVQFGEGVELEFVAEVVVDAEGVVEVGVPTELGLEITAFLDLATDEFLLEVIVIEPCGETPTEAPTTAPTDAPTTAPTDAPTTAPTDGTAPTQAAPTVRITPPPTDGAGAASSSSATLALPLLLLIVVAAGALLLVRARPSRTT